VPGSDAVKVLALAVCAVVYDEEHVGGCGAASVARGCVSDCQSILLGIGEAHVLVSATPQHHHQQQQQARHLLQPNVQTAHTLLVFLIVI
jgi:hypothetical protein